MPETERERLILEHLPQVGHIARKIHRGLSRAANLDDLISTGTMGLIAAVDHFDPSRGVLLKSYAEQKIRGAIFDALREIDWVSRTWRRRHKLVAQTKILLEQRHQREPTEEEIAAALNLSVKKYRDWRNQLQNVKLAPFETVQRLNLVAHRPGPADLAERTDLEQVLRQGVRRLPERQRTILSLHFGEDVSLLKISQALHLSQARVCQLKQQAVEHLRTYMKRKSWRPAPKPLMREYGFLRDLDGFIHSPTGYLSARRYDAVRKKYPDKGFPERATIPLMNSLSDDDLRAWYEPAALRSTK
jgi:RNA polymerase sigma factor for flagellar operon FliA